MPVFKLFTSCKFRDGGIKRFQDSVIPRIAAIIETDQKYVTVDIMDGITGMKREGSHITRCIVTYFGEFNDEVKEILSQGSLKLKDRLQKLFGEHNFYIKYMSYKVDDVLIDWRERSELIASIPIGNQGPKRNCWAHIAAFITGGTYSIEHPSITDIREITCSLQDLSDWVYSYNQLNNEIDEYGTYGTNGMEAFSYIEKVGVSLLQKYKTALLGERQEKDIQKTFNKTEFMDMLEKRGDRIFINNYDPTHPDTSLDDISVFSIELVTQILHQGMAYGSLYCCIHGCELCDGLDNFNGEGVYDEPLHPGDYNNNPHAVAVVGAGHLDGKDYISIGNTRGTTYANSGYANVHIKFLTKLIQVSGTRRETFIKTGGRLIHHPVTP